MKSSNARGYNYQWRKRRALYLKNHPLCVFCHEDGKIEEATVVDHIIPHKGDSVLFNDESNWQALCKLHHDSHKARQESGKDIRRVGLDGWRIE